MFSSVLVICVGNICRSPVGERLLKEKLTQRGGSITVTSAGLAAVVGHGIEDMAAAVASSHGLNVDGHVARQFRPDQGLQHDLILVMETKHRVSVIERMPSLSGRVMLFDQWIGAKGIQDPYGKSREFHEAIFNQIDAAATSWAEKLVRSPRGA